HTRSTRDWSSDVCSSDLGLRVRARDKRRWVDHTEHADCRVRGQGQRLQQHLGGGGVLRPVAGEENAEHGALLSTCMIPSMRTWRSEERRVGKYGINGDCA